MYLNYLLGYCNHIETSLNPDIYTNLYIHSSAYTNFIHISRIYFETFFSSSHINQISPHLGCSNLVFDWYYMIEIKNVVIK